MTVLEANQAYRAAMRILKDARMATIAEQDYYSHSVVCRAQDHLTEQEHADMKASFADGGAL